MKKLDPAQLPNINDQITSLRRAHDAEMREIRQSRQEALARRIASLEANRQACALLDAAGIELFQYDWAEPCESIQIRLGDAYASRTDRKRVQGTLKLIAATLGCHLDENGKYIRDGKRRVVEITLRPAKYPGIAITYADRLPKDGNGRCKIVKSRRKKSSYVDYDLVCEVNQTPAKV